MRVHLTALEAFKYGGLLLCGVAIFSAVLYFGFSDSIVSRLVARYTGHLDKTLRLLFREGSGKVIARWQAALFLAVIIVEFLVFDIPYWYAILAAIVVGPSVHLRRERSKRIAQLELQIDGFILALANSLKTVPSPAAALQAIMPILQNPTRQEIERVVAEMRVGNTLEQALVNMSARIGSKPMDSALSSVLVGLQVGGNLPAVLETTAATIREMNRLDGVVRTKTSEGRAQLWVLVVFPFAICAAFNWVTPGYFDILQKSFAGYMVITIAIVFWVASLVVAKKVLTVDI
ncbi:MAG: type II secretion system F family protein [Myxococcales bacterium]|nr:type II secretion system F family protein [Myxococcales bacterium]